MVPLFVCTLFLSSTLLFLVQPMIAKMVLPLLGGTPAVWNTCMVFFQATLLLGYLYVHALTKWLRPAQQATVHAALVTMSLLMLPVALAAHDEPPSTGTPIFWLARVLVLSVGVPFFVASTTGPLLQRWFARTGHASAGDPYFLSVAGNVGSIAALLAYPAGLEPRLRLADQSGLWALCYGVFTILIMAVIWMVYRSSACIDDDAKASADPSTRSGSAPRDVEETGRAPLPLASRLRWIALAFVPSSLMLGLTTFLTTDVAPVPLFWVVPLTLYLASFALVFARRRVVPHALMVRLLPVLALVLVTVLVFAGQLAPPLQAPLHLAMFFVAAMVCHGELAASRPGSARLTDFYLCMSLGGVLGGLFNALVAPLAFPSVVEYPLAIVLACAVAPPALTVSDPDKRSARRSSRSAPITFGDIVVPAALGAAVLLTLSFLSQRDVRNPITFALVFIAPPVACFALRARPLRFALALGALMMASSTYLSAHQPVALRGRSYYSVYKVVTDSSRRLRLLIHARTVHGAQSLDPARAAEPLTYYHRTGPIGQAFATFTGPLAKPRVAVVGLGAGSLAAYAEPGQQWTFYEIDPTIAAMARDPRYFTYLRDARAPVEIVLGDARLSLAKAPEGAFDAIVVDAFGSDAIPLHLLTREAMAVYSRALAPHGVIALHLSNRYMDLQPLVGNLTLDAGLAALTEDDRPIRPEEAETGKAPSTWLIAARSRGDLGPLASDPRWRAVQPTSTPTVWTDDFSNPLALLRLR
jgi:SAM-dependent methyltransferase